jgi:hypothetical protein
MISWVYFQDELRFTPWETERAELIYNIAGEISRNEVAMLVLKGEDRADVVLSSGSVFIRFRL